VQLFVQVLSLWLPALQSSRVSSKEAGGQLRLEKSGGAWWVETIGSWIA